MLLSRASPTIEQVESLAPSLQGHRVARVRRRVSPPLELEGHEAQVLGPAREDLPARRCPPLRGDTRTAYSVACSSTATAVSYSPRCIGASAPPRPAAVPSRACRDPSCRAAPPSAPRPALREQVRGRIAAFHAGRRGDRPSSPRDRPAPRQAPTTAAPPVGRGRAAAHPRRLRPGRRPPALASWRLTGRRLSLAGGPLKPRPICRAGAAPTATPRRPARGLVQRCWRRIGDAGHPAVPSA